MKNNLEIYFPGFTRKSVTFTIDDGNIQYDTKFLNIVRPAGIFGTFNLCAPTRTTPEEYRELYRGYEIANHCKNHPFCFDEGQPYTVLDEPFDKNTSREYTAEDSVVYKTETDYVYLIHTNPDRPRPDAWFHIASRENYLRFARETRTELEEIFGKGSVKSFVWPYREQTNTRLHEQLVADGYNSIRKTGAVEDTTDFDLPADRMRWSYNATSKSLLSVMEKYEKFEDDGRLKFFAFGVHSRDFEVGNNWCELEEFAEKYGNRPEDYYYASVSDIFEYEDAVKSLVITDTEIINDSDKAIYIKLSGERKIISHKSKISLI